MLNSLKILESLKMITLKFYSKQGNIYPSLHTILSRLNKASAFYFLFNVFAIHKWLRNTTFSFGGEGGFEFVFLLFLV